MALSRDSLNERILRIVRTTEFRLRQRIEYERWKEESLYPEVEALKANKAVLGLPDGMEFEFVLEPHANPDPTKDGDSGK